MYQLTVYAQEEKYLFAATEGNHLLDILQSNGMVIESPCGGKGTCGKCKVQIIQGLINALTAEELKYLTDEEIDQGIRLSCLVIPLGDLTVKLVHKKHVKHQILADGYMPELEINPVIAKKVYDLTKPTLENNLSYQDLLEVFLDAPILSGDPSLLRSLPEILKEEQVTAVYAGNELIGLEPGDTRGEMYGIAVDIGTTTVVLSLVDLSGGREVASETAINPQKEYGLDVLSRIDFVRRKENGLKVLQSAIIDCLNQLTAELCRKNNVLPESIYEITIAANATMMHLLLGVDTASIGKAPFATVFSKHQNFAAAALGLNLSPFARLYCLPSVSSYIGADIVAGVVVSQLKETHKNVLFIDMGTNGEIVLSKAGQLSSCSCAAGPALEGMNISCGMRASEGAIEGVEINDNEINLKVIGEAGPVGVCGSGILEAISEVSRVGLMAKTGRLKKKAELQSDEKLQGLAGFLLEEEGKRKVMIASTVKTIAITQGDIRQVQLAKGAILSGFYALLDLMEITMEDLDEVIIAGQFGKHLSVDSLVGIGIIPGELRDKIRYIGNSSKTGALMCLLSGEVREEMERIAKDICYYELSTMEGYERLFTRCLNFN